MEYKLLKIGTDAEVFLKRKETGNPVPVCGLVGGTKEAPKPVLGGGGYAVQEDNVMLEFNIPPASSISSFYGSIDKMLKHLTAEMGKEDLELDVKSHCFFQPHQLESSQAQTFGCEPDLCVWTKTKNSINTAHPVLQTMRTAAAHIHISYRFNGREPDILDNEALIMALDYFVGAPSLMLFHDNLRRMFYGRAGSFRSKPYGVEYRVLGNEWINNVYNIQWVWDSIQKAINWLNKHQSAGVEHLMARRELLEGAINDANPRFINKIYEEIKTYG